jgi:hypothetical protein
LRAANQPTGIETIDIATAAGAVISPAHRVLQHSHRSADSQALLCYFGLLPLRIPVDLMFDAENRVGVAMLQKSDGSKSLRPASKPYLKPTLVKGPVLTNVTADTAVSGAPIGVCWVARAAFGESDIRWMIFREWLLDDAPHWFRRLYIRHGELVGAWLAGRVSARRVVQALMMPAVNRKLRG